MLDFSTGQFVQLIVAMVAALVLFILSKTGLKKHIVYFLILTFPFQLLDSKFGSANVYMVLVVYFAHVLGGNNQTHNVFNRYIRLSTVLLAVVYVASFFYSQRVLKVEGLAYLVGLFSSYAFFVLVSDLINTEEELYTACKGLLYSNILVLLYCGIQLVVGFDQFVPFGVQEFAFSQNRIDQYGENRRLMGPFNAAEIISEYFVLMNVFLVAFLTHPKFRRPVVWGVLFGNLCALIGTGSRGGIISLVMACIVGIFIFRQIFSFGKFIKVGIACTFLLLISSYVMLEYTDFNVMYDRLAGTEFEGVTPDTRKRWVDYVEKSIDSPILGHGARIVTGGDLSLSPSIASYVMRSGLIVGYPHSLYIYIFYTLGALGAFGYLFLFSSIYFSIRRVGKMTYDSVFVRVLSKAGMVFFIVFLFDQLRIEYLRHTFSDFQHFIAISIAIIFSTAKFRCNADKK